MKQQEWLPLITLLIASLTPAYANATESTQDLLKQIPPIPANITSAQCEPGKRISQRAEEIAAKQLTEQAYSALTQTAHASAVTDEQGDALSHMTEESITQCIMDVSMASHDLVNRHLENLRQDLNKLQENKIRDDDRCGSGIGMDINCHNNVIQNYKNNVLTRTNTFLKNTGTPFMQWRNQALQCIELRNSAANAVLKTGMHGPFTIQAQAIITQNYSLVKAVADVYYDVCEAAIMAKQGLDY